ncbi:NADH oxidase H2O2-forming [Candidatus Phytoplasma luffae]|uniref:NADH oxidase H2O2-forming n=1 Tax=Loofah witches'-broom phytoplasma TaxID=35773 RepID=A0A975FJ41_LOWBP|nr:FAD-dependent oxidoreductase [Candidatus Phytoplasma luffae]QTX02834.1 NADH oxidase H2O2-forming [Candidatus Phytoplasma luffae]
MKIIVIGCNHSGTAATRTIFKKYKNVKINIYEKNDNVSFLSCGIALYVGGVVKDKKGLFYSNSEELTNLGATVRLKHEVLKIDLEKKEIVVKNLKNNKIFVDCFDKLILSTGSLPIVPQIKGIESKNILFSKTLENANKIIEYTKKINKVTIIGAGYIGVELAESFSKQNKDVTLIDVADRIMPKYLDKEFTSLAEESLKKHNVKLALNEKLLEFKTKDGLVTHVQTDKNCHETEMIIMCISFRPNTDLVKDLLEIEPNKALKVNEYLQTSHSDVYACGDCINIYYTPMEKKDIYIPLATNAVRTGTIVGLNIKKNFFKYSGTQGTSSIQINDLSISSTGLNEHTAKLFGIDYDCITIKDANRPEFMPRYDSVLLKILFEKKTRRLLGGQILSTVDLTEKINTLSVLIESKTTIDELAFKDFSFQPYFSKPWGLLNLAGIKYLENMNL